MARSWHYPRWRRILMQLTMVLILGGTVVLAEFVTRARNRGSVPKLEQVRKLEQLSVAMPAGWEISEEDGDELVAQEPRADEHGRLLLVRLEKVSGIESAEEFVRRSGLLSRPKDVAVLEDGEDGLSLEMHPHRMKTIEMAGQKGVMTSVVRASRLMPDVMPSLQNELIAATVLPSGTAVVVQLVSSEPDEGGDDAMLLKNVAAAIRLNAGK